MNHLLWEVFADNGWRPLLKQTDSLGSISDVSGAHREVYVEAGKDRVIYNEMETWIPLAKLTHGQTFELTLQTPRMPHPQRMRWTYIGSTH